MVLNFWPNLRHRAYNCGASKKKYAFQLSTLPQFPMTKVRDRATTGLVATWSLMGGGSLPAGHQRTGAQQPAAGAAAPAGHHGGPTDCGPLPHPRGMRLPRWRGRPPSRPGLPPGHPGVFPRPPGSGSTPEHLRTLWESVCIERSPLGSQKRWGMSL